jgi:transcriptional regulator with XRE-family HTH domain
MTSQPDRAGQPNRSIPASAMLAFERLLDLHERPGPAVDAATLEARRVCGRWLTLHRLERGLSLAEVAWRTGIDVQVLTLLEQGLAAMPAVEPAAWHALALVLEHPRNDFALVEEALAVTIGQSAPPDAAWLERLNAELLLSAEEFEASEQEAPAQPDLSLVETQLPQFVASLRVLRRAPGQTLSAFNIYQGVTQEENVALEFALLPEFMDKMQELQLVRRLETGRVLFELTDLGEQFFLAGSALLEAQRRLKDQERRTVEEKRLLEDQQRLANKAKAQLKRSIPNPGA